MPIKKFINLAPIQIMSLMKEPFMILALEFT